MTDATQILAGALTQALETMAFMEIMSIEEDMPAPDNVFLTRIEFSGPQRGCIEILAGADFAATLAENFAALDEVTQEDREDALGELANVTCGLVTPMIAADLSDEFDLTIPAVSVDEGLSKWKAFAEDEEGCEMNVEGHMIAAKLSMQPVAQTAQLDESSGA
jgi:chemotaxis protein CheY-P-specific phosphatase CheC